MPPQFKTKLTKLSSLSKKLSKASSSSSRSKSLSLSSPKTSLSSSSSSSAIVSLHKTDFRIAVTNDYLIQFGIRIKSKVVYYTTIKCFIMPLIWINLVKSLKTNTRHLKIWKCLGVPLTKTVYCLLLYGIRQGNVEGLYWSIHWIYWNQIHKTKY